MDQPPQDPTQPSQPAPPPPGPAWGQQTQPAPQAPGPAWGQPAAPPPPQYAPPPAPAGWAQPAPAATGWVQPAAVQGPVTTLAKIGGIIIALIAALWIFFAVVIIVGGAVTKGLFDSIGSGQDVSNAIGGAIAVFGVIILVFAVIEFLGGLGAAFGKDWGRIISIIYGLLFGVATLLIGVSALGSTRSVDSSVAGGAVGGALFFLVHGVLYLFATVVLMVRWRGRAQA